MKKLLYFIAAATMLTACQDFLELAPRSTTNAINFYKTEGDFKTAIVGAYQSFRSYPGMYIELSNYRSDEMYLISSTTGNLARFEISRFREVADNNIVANAWDNLYSGVARTNDILAFLEGSSISAEAKAQFTGEARFMRAFHYFNLVRLWGKVPLVLEPIGASEALRKQRDEVAQVYAAIEDDLLIAVANLPEMYPSSDAGRATKSAAKALLAKVYLTQEKWAEVRDVLVDIVNKSLLPKSGDVFDVTKKMNAEILFAVRYNKDIVGQGHGAWPQAISDTTSQDLSPTFLASFKSTDSRRALYYYKKEGTLYIVKKFFDTRSTINTTEYGNDFVLLRQADVQLMYAEALNELGYVADGDAFTYLNNIHTRAGLNAFSSATLTDQTVFRDSLLYERKLEFGLEGHRWFDLLRTDNALSELTAEFENVPVLNSDVNNIQEFRLVFPIPQKEVQKINNEVIFPQNPGYGAN